MPVGNQWKLKAQEEAAAKAAAAAAPDPQPTSTSTGDQGKKTGASRFRSKGAADSKQPEAPPAATGKDADGESNSADADQTNRPKSLIGKWTASQDDQKVRTATVGILKLAGRRNLAVSKIAPSLNLNSSCERSSQSPLG